MSGLALGSGAGGEFHPACGSRGERWFVALLRSGNHNRDPGDPRPGWQRVIEALAARGFGAWTPTVLQERRHARRVTLRQVPMFGAGYLFVRLDLGIPTWREAWHTPGVARILGPEPERPQPLPHGFVEGLLAAGCWSKPLTSDAAPALIAAGADVTVTDGPLVDHRGVCLWSDARRARVLLSILGRAVPVTLRREQVA